MAATGKETPDLGASSATGRKAPDNGVCMVPPLLSAAHEDLEVHRAAGAMPAC